MRAIKSVLVYPVAIREPGEGKLQTVLAYELPFFLVVQAANSERDFYLQMMKGGLKSQDMDEHGHVLRVVRCPTGPILRYPSLEAEDYRDAERYIRVPEDPCYLISDQRTYFPSACSYYAPTGDPSLREAPPLVHREELETRIIDDSQRAVAFQRMTENAGRLRLVGSIVHRFSDPKSIRISWRRRQRRIEIALADVPAPVFPRSSLMWSRNATYPGLILPADCPELAMAFAGKLVEQICEHTRIKRSSIEIRNYLGPGTRAEAPMKQGATEAALVLECAEQVCELWPANFPCRTEWAERAVDEAMRELLQGKPKPLLPSDLGTSAARAFGTLLAPGLLKSSDKALRTYALLARAYAQLVR